MKKYIPVRALLLFLAVAIVILISFGLWGAQIDAWVMNSVETHHTSRWIVALILFATLSSDIFLPIPSCIVSTMCGLYLGVELGTAVSFTAMTLSAVIGYFLGLTCADAAKRCIGERDMAALQRLQEKGGAFLILGMRPVPVLAEASVVFAGLARYPLRKTMVQVLVGNFLVSFSYAVIGHFSREALDRVWPAFVATMLVAALFMVIGRRRIRTAA